MLVDDKYEATSWREENERWKIAKEQKTIDDEIEVLSKAKIKELIKRWSGDYSQDELLFLENFYNKIVATQVSENIFKHVENMGKSAYMLINRGELEEYPDLVEEIERTFQELYDYFD